MGVIVKYITEGNDLILSERLHWIFRSEVEKQYCDYRLVDVKDLDNLKETLVSLINYGEEGEIEITQHDNQFIFSISTFLDDKMHQFFCAKIDKSYRSYSYEELKELAISFEERLNQLSNTSSITQSKFDKIYHYLDHEIKIRSEVQSNYRMDKCETEKLNMLRKLANLVGLEWQ